MAKLLPQLKARYFDINGAPLVGGLLYSYIAGTSTPLTTYADQSGGTPNANPVVLDANGQADVWLGNRIYKFVLTDSLGVVQWTVDNVDGSDTTPNATFPWASHNVLDGQAAADLTGETVDFATYSQGIFDVEIKRGTTVFATGQIVIQNVNGTGRIVPGMFITNEAHGVTFSISQVSTVCTLRAALDTGAGNGTIKCSRRLVPV